MKTLILPNTPMCRVVYHRTGTNYGAVIPTPKSTSELQIVMLARQVGVSQIQRLEPIQPLKPLNRPHPANHNLVKYTTIAES